MEQVLAWRDEYPLWSGRWVGHAITEAPNAAQRWVAYLHQETRSFYVADDADQQLGTGAREYGSVPNEPPGR